jgi:hypothetical protein
LFLGLLSVAAAKHVHEQRRNKIGHLAHVVGLSRSMNRFDAMGKR